MPKLLKILALTMGIACVAIGFAHIALGNASVPEMADAGVTADSQSRFFGAIFAGYGAAWIWAARRSPIPAPAIRWLAGIFLLGAFARVVSLAVHGWPHWFQIVLTVIEFVLPPLFYRLADADEKRVREERESLAPNRSRSLA
ncbi:DUF4345 domain-containing protein [Nocardia goodfellowii]|uniref:DUF4345 domain-containing protein n=1 Tax=Nocardia goodfellowii TaxID=882446 RepID=A0ABS4QF21_9NOCA|nr:DUF4345 domain-containing protein [Nocardia goodfellowii]MBP2190277.1 hypothetical protein [Nocardia goodfellowii]